MPSDKTGLYEVVNKHGYRLYGPECLEMCLMYADLEMSSGDIDIDVDFDLDQCDIVHDGEVIGRILPVE